MQWLEQAPLFSPPWLPCSPCEPPGASFLGRLQMHQKGSTPPLGCQALGSTAMETFMGPSLKCPPGEWSRIHQTVSPFPHESLWDLILAVAVLAQAATGAEQGISLPKTWGITEPFLRVRFSAQEPAEQICIILGWWQKGDIECWETAERYSSSSAFDLSWSSRSTGEHCTYLDFCHRWAGSENLGKKSPATWEIFPRIIKFYWNFPPKSSRVWVKMKSLSTSMTEY